MKYSTDLHALQNGKLIEQTQLIITRRPMEQFLSFVKKEFHHVFRDKKTLLVLFGMPIVQIILFGFALTNEVKNSEVVIVDYSKDAATLQLTNKIEASSYFSVEKMAMSRKDIESAFKSGKIKIAVVFPANFYNDLSHLNKAQLQVIADSSDPNSAVTLTNYLTSIVMDYQSELTKTTKLPYRIDPEVRMLYNPELSGAPNFVPGVMALVLMLICVMMTSISIVKEKEMGTMEILLVSPFKPFYVILSKAVPYFILSLVNITTILLLSVFVLGLSIKGSLVLLLAESILFILTSLSLGLLISVGAKTQQDAMTSSLMGMLLPTMLLTGFLFPIESMPLILQVISNLVPSHWYYIIVKDVMLKGLGFSAVWKESLILFGMMLLFITITIKKFKIRLA